MDLRILGCCKHNLIIIRKYLSVCDKNFVGFECVTQKLMHRISQNFIFSCTQQTFGVNCTTGDAVVSSFPIFKDTQSSASTA